MNQTSPRTISLPVIAIVFGALGIAAVAFFIGLFYGQYQEGLETSRHNSEVHLGQMDMINPLLACRPQEDLQFYPQDQMEKRIRGLIEDLKNRNQVSDMALIFRDLNNGPSFSVNPDSKYSGASLLKVPIMIGYLRLAEERPDVLLEQITYDPAKHDSANHFQLVDPPVRLVPGQNYAVDELMTRMITMSDNVATVMLGETHPEADVIPVLNSMGVELTFQQSDAFISVRAYASIFRILFNSTYLSRRYSNASLKLMSQSLFKRGLVAGVPADVPVAHKFGERSLQPNVQQFHDCGIIYKPGQPYLLCVMSRGANLEHLIKSVAEVSSAVYSELSESKPR